MHTNCLSEDRKVAQARRPVVVTRLIIRTCMLLNYCLLSLFFLTVASCSHSLLWFIKEHDLDSLTSCVDRQVKAIRSAKISHISLLNVITLPKKPMKEVLFRSSLPTDMAGKTNLFTDRGWQRCRMQLETSGCVSVKEWRHDGIPWNCNRLKKGNPKARRSDQVQICFKVFGFEGTPSIGIIPQGPHSDISKNTDKD